MLVTTIDLVELEPGEYLEWSFDTSDEGEPSAVPLSGNQRFHLAGLAGRADGRRDNEGWLAVTFDVPGPVRRELAAHAFVNLLSRHAGLCSTYESVGGELRRRTHDPRRLASRGFVSVAARVPSSADARALLWARLRRRCDPTVFPSALFAAIDRPERSTVVCGFDHSSVDALSMALILSELREDYLALADGGRPPERAPVGDFLEYCAYEIGQPPLPPEHPGLAIWRAFLAGQGGFFPSFPLDLGVPPGALAPQRTAVFRMLDATGAERVEATCKDHGGSLFSGELTALAMAVRDLGGPEQLATLTPMHTRLRPEWEKAVGWFVTNIPLAFGCGEGFADGVRQNRAAFRAMLPAAKVPIGQVLSGQAGPFAFARKDVSMVSHIDYRATLGPDPELRATHISNSTVADDAQFWFSRAQDGLWLRVRHPDTPAARTTVGLLRERLDEILAKQL